MGESISKQLEYLFSPRSVAVIGASNIAGKWGFNVFNRVLRSKADITIYPVSTSATEVLGVKAYRSLSEIPGMVDLAVVVVPPVVVPAVMQECISKGVKAAVVITAGFRETGEEGADLEKQVLEIARRGGIRFTGPNCNGHFSTASNLFTTGSEQVRGGVLALISQSGNFGGHILQRAEERGIGLSKYVSSGNEADLSLEDYFEYLADDKETRIITAYIEGIKDGRRFLELAKRITKKKPIVVMKVGRTPEGAKAAMSHTGSLAGSDAVHDAVFRQCGVIRVDMVEELFDVALALVRLPLPQGRRVGIVTTGGGFGVVATDACRRLGLEIPPLRDETIKTLNRYLPSRWSHSNPIDMAGDSEGAYACMGTLLKAENIDAVLAVGSVGYPGRDRGSDGIAEVARDAHAVREQWMVETELGLVDGLIERMERHKKPVVITASMGGSRAPAIAKLAQKGIYEYNTPERGAKVISHLVRYSEYLKEANEA